MQVTVIGCSTCWTNKPVSSYCINGNILVDCGEGTTKHYKKCGVDFFEIKHIFITHFHTDHFTGLSAHISQVLAYEGEDKKYRLNIYGPKGLLKALNIFKENFACPSINKRVEDYINVFELENNSQICVEGLKIKAFKLDHGGIENLAYVFDDDKVKVGFSGDCTYTKQVDNFVKNCDVAFVDCCSEKTTKNHMGADKFCYLQGKFLKTKMIAVHSTDEFLKKAKKYKIKTTKSAKKYRF